MILALWIKNQSLIDSLTHIVLGACAGEALLGKKLGRRSMFLGALGQSIPDIDFIAILWTDVSSNLLAHRGFTHSLLFGILATVAFALAAEHWHRSHKVGFNRWLLFFGVEIAMHLLLDIYNNYGIGLLEPFSHTRFSFNALFVADPFFSIVPAIAFTVLLVLKRKDERRTWWWRLGVGWCGIYLLYCTLNKIKITDDTKEILEARNITYSRFLTTPTPLNNWLWYIVAEDKDGYHVGFRSMFDSKKQINFNYFPRHEEFLEPFQGHEELYDLLRFSQGYYTVEKWHDTTVFNDLRFGQIIGWHDPRERFVFHYFLKHPAESNRLVVQRGRFAKWDRHSIRSMLRRIKGN